MKSNENNCNDGLQNAGFGAWESKIIRALMMARKECTSNEISMMSGLTPYKISLTAKTLSGLGLTTARNQQCTGRGHPEKVYALAVNPTDVKDYLISMIAAEVGGM